MAKLIRVCRGLKAQQAYRATVVTNRRWEVSAIGLFLGQGGSESALSHLDS